MLVCVHVCAVTSIFVPLVYLFDNYICALYHYHHHYHRHHQNHYHNHWTDYEMAFERTDELVGKRFLCLRCVLHLKPQKLSDWPWRSGVIRASSHRDLRHSDLSVSFSECFWFIILISLFLFYVYMFNLHVRFFSNFIINLITNLACEPQYSRV